jgi:hypothetical protein
MERLLNRYAGAEVAAVQRPAYGGYGSIAAMRSDAQSNLAQAWALGVTDAGVQNARQRLDGQVIAAAVLVGQFEACNSLINNLAWAGARPDNALAVKPRTILFGTLEVSCKQ